MTASSSVADAPGPATFTRPPPAQRIFLVVVDESDEFAVALRYACCRARNSGGRVALLRVIEPTEFQHWRAVEELMREERRQEAEQVLLGWAEQVKERTGALPILHLREGGRVEALMKLIEEEPSISILVLAAGTDPAGPGPLISYLATSNINRLRVPLVIVPGTLRDDQIEAIS